MPDLTLVIPYYRNPVMLQVQFEGWANWHPKRKERLRVILVDDGSPEPAIDVPRPDGLPELEIYRVTEDRPWHQHGARNLGAHVAPEGWLLLTDMDHALTDEAARALFKRIDTGKLSERRAYMLSRIEADSGEPTLHPVSGKPKPHPNSFVMTRAKYWEVGGYDEDLCGHYGTDSAFRGRLNAPEILPVALTRYWRELVPDASTDAPRKEGREPGVIKKIIADKMARGEGPKVLQFPWERVL